MFFFSPFLHSQPASGLPTHSFSVLLLALVVSYHDSSLAFFLILPFPLDDDALAARLIAANI
jgi:hypothetical protein